MCERLRARLFTEIRAGQASLNGYAIKADVPVDSCSMSQTAGGISEVKEREIQQDERI